MKVLIYTAIVALLMVASCSKKTSAPTTATAKVYDGAQLFASNCARCHGAQGVKDERTPNLQTIPLDKAALVKSISFGKGRMPAFADKLNDAELSAVADLIVSWHK
jgi:mono/diheme cytochrome c family protein